MCPKPFFVKPLTQLPLRPAMRFCLVTKDMVPSVWHLSEAQEAEWLAHVAGEFPDYAPDELCRAVVVELPDFPLAYAYQQAYAEAAASRSDLVMPIITSLEQWDDRREEMATVMRCLLEGAPPLAAIAAMALRGSKKRKH